MPASHPPPPRPPASAPTQRLLPRRRVVGLLGSVASGKSHVASRLAVLGPGRVVDADRLAHEALDQAASDGRLAALFGPGVVSGCSANRAALRAKAHADAGVLRALEGLTHPFVRQGIADAVAAHRRGEGPPLLVLDVPLLLEAGLDRLCDELWFVDAPEALRRARALARGTPPEALERWAAHQASDAVKRARATRVVANDSDPAALDTQIRDALAAPAPA